jgi:hypothetical protein
VPIVFVHGVNNRKEDSDYASGVDTKRAYFQSLLASGIGLTAKLVAVEFPYWGGYGVTFRWNQASLPSESDAVVALGKNKVAAAEELWLGEARYQAGMSEVNFGEMSRNGRFLAAIDLIWDTASVVGSADTQSIIDHYEASLRYAQANPVPGWAMQAPPLTNAQFADRLLQESKPYLPHGAVSNGVVALGIGDWFRSLKESVSRLADAPADAASSVLTSLGRKSMHDKASRFLGDIFVYLTKRDDTRPDSLLADLLEKLRAAHASRRPGDDQLVVVGHSLGGLLAYDVLTSYAPEIHVDHFVTVGSQVALFEEMTLCKASRQGVPAHPPTDRLARPANIGRWINVYDTNDVFSFRAEGVFSEVTDYKFDTGYGMLQAHSGYFERPSFYKRLAARIVGA